MSISAIKPALPGTRRLMRFAGGATVLAVSQLYVFPADTDRFFAWTINPPISAAFMGAGFGAGAVLMVGMWRETSWARVRLSFTAVFAFTIVTLAATLIHIDRFHFGAGGVAETAAWLWVGVYVVFPVAMATMLVLQRRVGGNDPSGGARMPMWLRVVLGFVGIVTVGVGIALFVLPENMASVWPWSLSPLVARAIAGWLVGLGAAALLAIGEGDLSRLRVPGVAYLVFGGLMLLALLRLRDQVDWARPSAWALVTWLGILSAIGLYGATLRARRGGDPALGSVR